MLAIAGLCSGWDRDLRDPLVLQWALILGVLAYFISDLIQRRSA
jgi:hypothetical protein